MQIDDENRFAAWFVAVVAGLIVQLGALFVAGSDAYFRHRLDAHLPDWISDLFLGGRRFAGHFRAPPENDEMTRNFERHAAEFEALAEAYYGIARLRQEQQTQRAGAAGPTPDPEALLAALRFRMAALGVDSVDSNAGFLHSPDSGEMFENLGLQFSLFDRGGDLRAIDNGRKGYAYAPRLAGQKPGTRPILYYQNTGQYTLATGLPEVCRKRETDTCCGMAVIDAHWAVTTCQYSSPP